MKFLNYWHTIEICICIHTYGPYALLSTSTNVVGNTYVFVVLSCHLGQTNMCTKCKPNYQWPLESLKQLQDYNIFNFNISSLINTV